VPVSYLFVPGDRPDRFGKAIASGADAVIIDLEDAVAPGAKPAARESLVQWAHSPAAAAAHASALSVYVRTNAADTPWFADDLAALAALDGIGVMLPKSDDTRTLARVSALPGKRPGAIALIESVAGLDAADALARVKGIARLAFGALDYAIDAGVELDADRSGAALTVPMTLIALAARRAQLPAPIDGVTVALDDAAALEQDVRRARALGFGAKLCIHPRQVAAVHAAFAPGAHELDWARRVLAASHAGAAAQVDGRMVDRPVVLRAQAIIARAR
jgi:citrate lyase subunit beta/citryl-CoA lyase